MWGEKLLIKRVLAWISIIPIASSWALSTESKLIKVGKERIGKILRGVGRVGTLHEKK